MNIIYPPLVEEGYLYLKQHTDLNYSKADVYRLMLEENIIDISGYPTDFALESGMVSEVVEEYDMSFNEFLEVYPVFRSFPKDNFLKIEGFWEISKDFRILLEEGLKSGIFNAKEATELQTYLLSRPYTEAVDVDTLKEEQ